jgi:hypothetical protein
MGRPTRGWRVLVAIGLAPLIMGAGGCLGDDPKLDVTLARYRGTGFTAGYPRTWARPPGDRRLVPGSLFEVTSPAAGEPTASFDILTHWGGTQLLDSVVSDFMRVSRGQRGFRLTGEERIDVTGHPGYEVSQEYQVQLRGTSALFRTVDWFAQLKNGAVVDVRIGFPGDRYDPSLVSSVRRSLSIG